MTVTIPCPSCGRTLRAEEEQLGTRVRCPSCGDAFVAWDEPLEETIEEPLPRRRRRKKQQESGGFAIASLVLGMISLLAWCLPLVGLPVSIVGLVLGIKGTWSSQRSLAIAGIVLSSIGLLFTLVNSAVGAYLGATGKLAGFK